MIKKTEHWTLTVSFWGVLPEGVRPFRTAGSGFGHEWKPGEHKPTEFEFTNPPSRQDFFDTYKLLPWMTTWKDDVMPAIAVSQWPFIQMGKKGATTAIINVDGIKVGELQVWRSQRFDNTGYNEPFVGMDAIEAVLRYVPKTKREEINGMIRANENLICERCILAGDTGEDQVIAEIRNLLVEKGLRKAA